MNKQKIKGTGFEREAAKLLQDRIKYSKFERVPGSGAIGTTMGESILTGDIRGKAEKFPKKFKGECKVGYSRNTVNGAKQMTIKKEWLDKAIDEASGDFSFPFLIVKFENVRQGVRHAVMLDIDDFAYLINMIQDMTDDGE